MKHCLRILIFLLLTLQLPAQVNTFTLNFHFGNNDEAYSVIQNTAGNYVVCGYVYPGGNNFDPIVAEVSPNGVVLQSYTLTTTTSEIFKSIIQTSDGGYFITGNVFTSPSDFNALLLKLDGNFQLQFSRQITNTGINDNANRGFEIAPGIYGVTGSLGLSGAVKPTYLVLDNNGNIVSQTYLGTNQFASPDYRGRYIGNGQVTMGHLTNAFSILDSSGTVVKSFNSGLGIYSVDVQRLSNGNFACLSLDNYGSMAGSTSSFMVVDSSCTNVLFSKKFGLNGNDVQPSEFIQDADGNLLLSGKISSLSSGNETPYLIKLDSSGNTLWMKSYLPSGASTARFNAVSPTADGGYILCGAVGPYNAQHLFLMKLDSAGDAGSCNVLGVSFTTSTPATLSQTTHPVFTASATASSATATLSTSTLIQNIICATTGIDENVTADQPSLYPVPAKEFIYIQSSYSGSIHVKIYDMSGRCVSTCHLQPGAPVFIGTLATGYYILTGTNEEGTEIIREKLAKE